MMGQYSASDSTTKERMSPKYKCVGNVDDVVEVEEEDTCPLLPPDEGKH